MTKNTGNILEFFKISINKLFDTLSASRCRILVPLLSKFYSMNETENRNLIKHYHVFILIVIFITTITPQKHITHEFDNVIVTD